MEFDHSTETITPNVLSSLSIGGTAGMVIPVGTTLQRSGSPTTGTIRLNTTLGLVEYYNGSIWVSLSASIGTGTVTSVSATAPTEGFTISGSPITTSGNLTFTLANDLAGLEGLTTNGLSVRTATSTWTTRSISVGSSKLIISNGDGISGNPTLDLGTVILDHLSDVVISTPLENHILTYSGTSWVNTPAPVPPPSGGGATVQIKFNTIGTFTGTATIPLSTVAPAQTAGTVIWYDTINIQKSSSSVKISSSMVIAGSTNSMEFGIVCWRFLENTWTLIGSSLISSGNTNLGNIATFIFYDSPNTIGNVSYQLRFGKVSGNGTWYINVRPGFPNTWGGSLLNNAYSIEEIGVVL